MNAAFLLVTSALLVGQGGDKKPAPPPPPVTAVAPAVVSNGCGSDPCGCEEFGHRLRGRMRGLFNRDNCDSCQPTTCHTTCAPAPVAHNHCDDACRPKIWNWQPRGRTYNTCAPATCNDGCGRAHGGIFERLRGAFQRNDSCCDGGCGSSNGTVPSHPQPAVKPGETINPPKKMPADPIPPPKKAVGSVSIGTPVAPFAPNTISVAPSVPSVELAPVPSPRVEGDRRDPF